MSLSAVFKYMAMQAVDCRLEIWL